MARIKVVSFSVYPSRDQALRWARVARYLGCRSVSAWLEEKAQRLEDLTWEQVKRLEDLALYLSL
jgi:hypothetical protein